MPETAVARFVSDRPLVAAIPVRDEEDRIGACLAALAGQRGGRLDHLVLLLNNTTDATAARVEALRPSLPFPLTVALRHYPAEAAHAGTARAEAMEIAAALAGPEGILLTSDADGCARPDWIAVNRAALARGAEVVCGRAEIDPVEAALIPAILHADDVAEVAYATLLDEIHALADPDPHDPWPRHTEHSGASIAVTVRAWQRAGGVPPLRSAEDRGFLQALRRVDAAIRHAPEAVVTVSGRIVGRAAGGMAETMARRIRQQDSELDDSLEPAADCLRRAILRAGLRALHGHQPTREALDAYASEAGLPTETLLSFLDRPWFGDVWARIEAESPRLARHRVARAELARHAADALAMLRPLREGQGLCPWTPPKASLWNPSLKNRGLGPSRESVLRTTAPAGSRGSAPGLTSPADPAGTSRRPHHPEDAASARTRRRLP